MICSCSSSASTPASSSEVTRNSGQASASPSASCPAVSTSTRRSGSGSQPVPSSSRSASRAMSPFLEVVDQPRRLLALGLVHGFENAGLGDATEIVVDGRLPTGYHHVESDGTSQDIGFAEPVAGAY